MTNTEAFVFGWVLFGVITFWLTPLALVESLAKRRGAGSWMAVLTLFLPVLGPIFIIILLLQKPNIDAIRGRLERTQRSLAGAAQPMAVPEDQITKSASLSPFWIGLVFAILWPILWMIVLQIAQTN